MNETEVTAADVAREHLSQVNVLGHWLYLIGVLGLSTLGMLVLIVLLGGG
jgi:hypothetical protein